MGEELLTITHPLTQEAQSRAFCGSMGLVADRGAREGEARKSLIVVSSGRTREEGKPACLTCFNHCRGP
jgi:hypothetical protein